MEMIGPSAVLHHSPLNSSPVTAVSGSHYTVTHLLCRWTYSQSPSVLPWLAGLGAMLYHGPRYLQACCEGGTVLEGGGAEADTSERDACSHCHDALDAATT